jgi:hypothetical protein
MTGGPMLRHCSHIGNFGSEPDFAIFSGRDNNIRLVARAFWTSPYQDSKPLGNSHGK